MAKLTTKARKQISDKNFALPGRRYPIEDRAHAANAKARVSQFGTPAEKAEVDRKVKARFGFAGGGDVDYMKELAKYAGGGAVDDDDDQEDDDDEDDQAATTQPVDRTPSSQPDRQPAAASQASAVDIRQQLQDYLAKQKAGTDAMAALAQKHKEALEELAGRPNRAPLNALADHYYGTNFSKVIPKTPTAADVTGAELADQGNVTKAMQPVTQDLLREYGGETSNLTKAQVASERAREAYFRDATRAQAQRDKASTTATKQDAKDESEFEKRVKMDKSWQEGDAAQEQADTLMDSVNQAVTDKAAAQSLPTTLANYASRGKRLHTSTIDAFTNPNSDLLTRIRMAYSKGTKGTIPQDVADDINRYLQLEKQGGEYQKNRVVQHYAEDFNRIHDRYPKMYDPTAPVVRQAPAVAAGGPPVAGAKAVKNAKTGQKGWLTPDGKILPR